MFLLKLPHITPNYSISQFFEKYKDFGENLPLNIISKVCEKIFEESFRKLLQSGRKCGIILNCMKGC